MKLISDISAMRWTPPIQAANNTVRPCLVNGQHSSPIEFPCCWILVFFFLCHMLKTRQKQHFFSQKHYCFLQDSWSLCWGDVAGLSFLCKHQKLCRTIWTKKTVSLNNVFATVDLFITVQLLIFVCGGLISHNWCQITLIIIAFHPQGHVPH